MATRYGVDMGNVLSRAESIKGQKMQNQLTQQRLDESTNANNFKSDALNAKTEEEKKMLVLAYPKQGAAFLNQLDKMNKSQAEKVQKIADAQGREAYTIRNTQNPEEKALLFDQHLQSLSDEDLAEIDMESLSTPEGQNRYLSKVIMGSSAVWNLSEKAKGKSKATTKANISPADEKHLVKLVTKELGGEEGPFGALTRGETDPKTISQDVVGIIKEKRAGNHKTYIEAMKAYYKDREETIPKDMRETAAAIIEDVAEKVVGNKPKNSLNVEVVTKKPKKPVKIKPKKTNDPADLRSRLGL